MGCSVAGYGDVEFGLMMAAGWGEADGEGGEEVWSGEGRRDRFGMVVLDWT